MLYLVYLSNKKHYTKMKAYEGCSPWMAERIARTIVCDRTEVNIDVWVDDELVTTLSSADQLVDFINKNKIPVDNFLKL